MTQQKNISNGVPPPRWVLKIFTKINVIVYKLSGGRLMDKLSGMPILLVEMKGVRSGKKADHSIDVRAAWGWLSTGGIARWRSETSSVASQPGRLPGCAYYLWGAD